jgi:hypothetical protein
MRGSAASHTEENLQRFVPTINCRGNNNVTQQTAQRHRARGLFFTSVIAGSEATKQSTRTGLADTSMVVTAQSGGNDNGNYGDDK